MKSHSEIKNKNIGKKIVLIICLLILSLTLMFGLQNELVGKVLLIGSGSIGIKLLFDILIFER